MSQSVTKPTSTKEEKFIEYTPFGGDTKVKLSLQIVLKFLCKPTSRGQLPTESDAMKFMMLCHARALNPFEGDAYLVGYDGQSGPEFSIITGVQAFYKRAEVSPEYDGLESGIIVRREDGTTVELEGEYHDDNETVVGGWAKVFRKNRSHPTKSRIRINGFKKNNKFWNSDPAGMIAKCAEADALRREFPTKLGGLYIPGEQFRSHEDMAIAAAKPAIATNIANLLPEPSAPEPALQPQDEPERVPIERETEAPTERTERPAAKQERKAAPAEHEITPQAKLLALVTGACHTESNFMALAHDQGWALESQKTIAEIPDAKAAHLVKSWQSIVKGLNAAYPAGGAA